MKIMLNDRSESITTTSTILSDYPLENLSGIVQNEVTKSDSNVLALQFTTVEHTTTCIAGFNTNADTVYIKVTDIDGVVVFEETIYVTLWESIPDAFFDDYERDGRKSFWIDFEPQYAQCTIDLTLTAPAGEYCYVGPMRVDRAMVFENPVYGLQKYPKINDVVISRLDATEYIRSRTAQWVYSGEIVVPRDSEMIVIAQQIKHVTGAKPIPVHVVDDDIDLVVYGKLDLQRTMTLPEYDSYNFTITEAV